MKRFHERHRHRIISRRRLESLESRLALSGVSPGTPEDYPDLPEDVFTPPTEVEDINRKDFPIPFTDDFDLPFVPLPPAPIGPEGPG